MTARDAVATRTGPMLTAPGTLLLDFGGVIVESHDRPEGIAEVAAELTGLLLARRGTAPPVDRTTADIRAGVAAWDRWKRARSRESAPRDVSHQEFWARFVTRDWDEPARRVVADAAFELCRSLAGRTSVRSPRPGIRRLLDIAVAAGMHIGVVSNALSGVVHRELLELHGLADAIAIQLYSDELGIRKPNPELILSAIRSLGGDPASTWYVGDQHDRDVLCGRRAHVGTVILMRGQRHSLPAGRRSSPDLEVADPAALADVLERVSVTPRAVVA